MQECFRSILLPQRDLHGRLVIQPRSNLGGHLRLEVSLLKAQMDHSCSWKGTGVFPLLRRWMAEAVFYGVVITCYFSCVGAQTARSVSGWKLYRYFRDRVLQINCFYCFKVKLFLNLVFSSCSFLLPKSLLTRHVNWRELH